MLILSMDFGTSSLKMGVYTQNLIPVRTLKVEYQYRVYNQNWVELDADNVISAMLVGLNGLSDFLDKIELVTFDTFSPSVTIMDIDGKALYPIITHLDRRSKEQMELITRVIGVKKFQDITGIQPFIGGASITTILWLMKNEPELFHKTYKVAHFNTYIYHLLTGCWVTDQVNASMTGLFETVDSNCWSEQICKTFGIPKHILPEIYQAGKIAGHLSKHASLLTGLKAGIPVAVGSNDAATAQVGAGNTKTGDILIISGSSEMISILSDKPVTNDKYYLRKAATPGLWQIFAITASGLVIDWFRSEFYRDMDAATFYSGEFPEAIDFGIDSSEIQFEPYIAGDRQSLIPKTGAFTGITLESCRRDFLAAILMGFHKPIIETMDIASKYLKLNNVIKLTGGMVDDAFMKLKRKLFSGYDFEIIENCPLIGNIILALHSH